MIATPALPSSIPPPFGGIVSHRATRCFLMDARGPVPMLWLLPGPAVGTCGNLHCRCLASALRVCSCRSLWQETADPGITTEPTGLTASQSRPADIITTAAVHGRSAALDVCVASSIAAAARGNAAQAAFDRKLTHYRNELGELRQQKIHFRPLVWTADGRHPAVTRPLQYAADIASTGMGSRCRRNPASQMETRNPNRSPTPKGSHGSGSSPESSSEGRALRRHDRQSPAPLGSCPRP